MVFKARFFEDQKWQETEVCFGFLRDHFLGDALHILHQTRKYREERKKSFFPYTARSMLVEKFFLVFVFVLPDDFSPQKKREGNEYG